MDILVVSTLGVLRRRLLWTFPWRMFSVLLGMYLGAGCLAHLLAEQHFSVGGADQFLKFPICCGPYFSKVQSHGLGWCGTIELLWKSLNVHSYSPLALSSDLAKGGDKLHQPPLCLFHWRLFLLTPKHGWPPESVPTLCYALYTVLLETPSTLM